MLIEAISLRSKVPMETLQRIARSASKRYFEFTIPKRDGGERTIAHPSRPLKALQRWIARNVIGLAPVHDAATAYSKGSKISDNASRHAATYFTTRLDLRNFFPSFDSRSVADFFLELSNKHGLGYSEADILFATRIVCRNGSLAIGAPSSPKLTNAMMFEFDSHISQIAINSNVVYTRYADDMFISGFDIQALSNVEYEIRKSISEHKRPKLELKEEKTIRLSRAKHRSITGLTITPEGGVSLGRQRKRKIRTFVYLAIEGKLSAADRAALAGHLAHASDVEPDFVNRLGRKFAIDVREWAKSL